MCPLTSGGLVNRNRGVSVQAWLPEEEEGHRCVGPVQTAGTGETGILEVIFSGTGTVVGCWENGHVLLYFEMGFK